MKNFTISFALLFCFLGFQLFGQNVQQLVVKSTTDYETGSHFITQFENSPINNYFSTKETGTKDVTVNWQFTDAGAIGSKVKVSSETEQTFVEWSLNNKRVSLYGNSSSPVWENIVDTEWDWPIDMTPDGEWSVAGYDTVAMVFSTSSSSIYWEVILPGTMLGTELSPDGNKLFIARNYAGNSYISSYTVGENDPNWEVMFENGGTVFTASDDGSTLVFCQYTTGNTMWILDADNGDILFDAYYKNQNSPALSYDGSIILNGDYSGNVYLYEADEANNTYIEKWSYKVNGGGTSDWTVGLGVSGDGSTVAVGTLVFTTAGGFDGEMYLFNSWSPIPLWIFSGAGDEISSISISDDGSLIAASSWGPLDHSKPDLFLFRKQSSTPIYGLSTPGSFNTVHLSPDGSLCAVAGKAVHAREFGSGGFLYNIDSDPDGAIAFGTVGLQNSATHENVKIEIEEIEDYFTYSNIDGDHELKYIPPGVYSVTASKVGYYSETAVDIQFNEGDEIYLDFYLEETGTPPENLTATHGAGLYIRLDWEFEDAQDLLGFNVYRKTILEDFYPEEPLATVSNSTFYYEDLDILPLTDYYYAVTAILEADVQSPYSNTEIGWMADGFITTEISAYSGSNPVIDGTIAAGEWDDAFYLDASDFLGKYDVVPNPVGSVKMWYKVNESMTELYIACINENDTELEDHDEVALYIDDNNDGEYGESGDNSEGNFWAAYYASGSVIKYRPIYNNGGVGDVIYLDNPQIAVSDETGVIVYEFMIPIGDMEDWQINPNANNESGFFLFVLDDPTAFDGYWPCNNPEIFIPTDYGQITFDAENAAPPPPINMDIHWTGLGPVDIILEWDQPNINDFDHFNIFMSESGGSWELLDNTIGTQISYMSTNTNYKEFYVTTVDQTNQESDPSAIVVYDFTIGTVEIIANAFYSVYPNPSNGQVNITMDISETGNYDLRVVGIDGRIIQTIHNGNLNKGKKTIRWDGKDASGQIVPNGIYFLSLIGNNIHSQQKVVMIR